MLVLYEYLSVLREPGPSGDTPTAAPVHGTAVKRLRHIYELYEREAQ